MGSMSIWHWIIVALIVMLLFGRGRISEMMGDLAKGINAFKKGLAEDEAPTGATSQQNPPQVTQQSNPADQSAAATPSAAAPEEPRQ